MILISWNSQGDKWWFSNNNILRKYYKYEEPVIFLSCESGIPGWSNSGKTNLPERGINLIDFDYDTDSAHHPFPKRNQFSFWPWVLKSDSGNIRCSFSMVYFFNGGKSRVNSSLRRYNKYNKNTKRPAVIHYLKVSELDTEQICILQVHLTASKGMAMAELGVLLRIAGEINRLTPTMIVGDINLDADDIEKTMSNFEKQFKGWYILKSDAPTHHSQGPKGTSRKLDWAIVSSNLDSRYDVSFSEIPDRSGYSDHEIMVFNISEPREINQRNRSQPNK